MRTALLKTFDRFLSPLACAFAGLVPRTAGKRAYTPVVIRPGGLGDLVCADMALQAIGRDARDFMWLIEGRSQPWAEHRGLPHLCYEHEPRQTLQAVFGRFKLVINTEQLFGLSQAYGLLTRAPQGRLVSFDTNRGAASADLQVPYDWKDAHEVMEFARLFAAALDLSEANFANFARPRAQSASGPPLVLIAGRQSRSRSLPIETWENMVEAWAGPRQFLIAAAPEDAAFADQLAQRFAGVAGRFAGPFGELCRQIAMSEELLTVDGGGVHIASFYGVPTVALFTSGRDGKWSPLAAGSRVVRRHDLACQPCTQFGQVPPCPNAYACQELRGTEKE